MANVSFFNEIDQKAERKRRMAQALMLQAKKKANRGNEMVSGIVVKKSPLEGLANALEQGVHGYNARSVDKEADDRKKAATENMAKALGLYNKNQEGGTTELESGENIAWDGSPEKASSVYQRVLSQNEDTAPYAMQDVMSQMQGQRDQTNALELMKAKAPFQLEQARALAGIRAAASGSNVGGNTGVLLDRLVAEDNGLDSLRDALIDLKGGAGSTGRLNAEIDLGNEAKYQTQTGSNRSDLQYKPQIAGQSALQSGRGVRQATREGEALEKYITDEQSMSTIADLRELNNSSPKGAYAGKTQFLRKLAPGTSEKEASIELMKQARLGMAAPLAKQLGVNPTDKDFQNTLDQIFDIDATREVRAMQIDALEKKIQIRQQSRQEILAPTYDQYPTQDPAIGPANPAATLPYDQISPVLQDEAPNPILEEARQAIESGAPREAVIQRLQQMGIDTGGL